MKTVKQTFTPVPAGAVRITICTATPAGEELTVLQTTTKAEAKMIIGLVTYDHNVRNLKV